MSRSEQRRLAFQFIVSTILWLTCIFAWVAVLTFDPADPPSSTVWPVNAQPRNWCGGVGAWFAFQFFYYLGVGTFPLLLLVTTAIAAWSHGLKVTDLWVRFVGAALIGSATSTLAALFLAPTERFLISGPGGTVGKAGSWFLGQHLRTPGTLIVLASILIIGAVLAADTVVIRLFRWLLGFGKRTGPALLRGGGQVLAGVGSSIAGTVTNVSGRLAPAGADLPAGRRGEKRSSDAAHPPRQLQLELEEPDDEEDAPSAPAESTEKRPPKDDWRNRIEEMPVETEDDGPGRIMPFAPAVKEAGDLLEVRKLGRSQSSLSPGGAILSAGPVASSENYETPPISLLGDPDPIDKDSIEILCREKAYILEQTLTEFRLEVRVVAIETGPVITVFELKLAPGIKVSQIVSLSNDMARALKAPSVRVVAPLPGKNTIGIEVPNIDKEKVRLKDLLIQSAARTKSHGIPLYLGKDASGQPLVSDLTKMPHLLIAGTTGSGKSVCVASIISSILLTRTPEECNLILVDPKVVELSIFKDIPHLMCPIVTEISKAESILDWAASKMDERYSLLAEAGVKDIRSYNKLTPRELRERMRLESDEELAHVPLKLPYIVIVIDELADLMMTSAKEVEFYLCRLAQKSRAVGIHLIVSTQRPQANVVTGLIKSNLPCRIAFRVSSRLDSRIVLDQNGGETLMGQGDMLFLPPGSSKLIRAQGTYIPDEELRAIVDHCRKQRQPAYNPELVRIPKPGGEDAGERDELFDQAVDIIIESGRGSVSLLQRRLTIGYGRASRLVDQMYEAGIVGEYKGSQAREVLLTKEEWEATRNARDREEACEQLEED